ncbi:unnamed protein product [Schistosoma margrebowiei]|uniref:Uncharacterized protein n=1 Tax=Schistosoma margrebowiei TaxID=48269 RepID=A0A183LDB8_9TREM|nr:unnamed protein product [Schistosoma margrebowiei]
MVDMVGRMGISHVTTKECRLLLQRKLSGNRRKPERPLKRKEGEVITNIEEQQNKWVEHFKELLNRPAPLNPPNIEAAPTDLPTNVGPPTIEEISMTIRQIKSGKAAGPDNIPAEALKADDWVPSTPELVIGSEVVECVDRFTYLGSLISPCSLVCDEISARIQKARLAFANLRHLWRKRDIRLSTKGRVYCAAVRPVLLYGNHTVIPNKLVIIKIKLRNLPQQIKTHADEIDKRNRGEIGTVPALIEVFGTSCQLTWTTTVRKPVDKQERATDTKTGMSIGIPSMEHPSTLMMTCRGSASSLRRRY